jgi:hypothetical protein
VLFDSYELHLEHMVSSDPLFIFLVTIAVVMLCWSDQPSVAVAAVAGLLIGYATTVRSVGEPVIVVVLVGMLARRMGWRRLFTVTIAWLIPVATYMALFHHFTASTAGPSPMARSSTAGSAPSPSARR